MSKREPTEISGVAAKAELLSDLLLREGFIKRTPSDLIKEKFANMLNQYNFTSIANLYSWNVNKALTDDNLKAQLVENLENTSL